MADETKDLTGRILHLRSIPVCAELEPRVIHVIAAALRDRVFEPGAVLMRQGEPIEKMHLLLDGSLALTRDKKPFGKLAPPQSLGFLGILAQNDGAYDAAVTHDRQVMRCLKQGHEGRVDLRRRFSDRRVGSRRAVVSDQWR